MRPFNFILNILRFNRRNWRAVVLCVFAATIFWFFNALNKNYTTNINFPLRFDYDQENFIPVKNLPEFVRINVTGNGWDLFKRSTGVKLVAVEIPLERPAETKKIVGSTLPVYFSTQVDGLEVNFVLTDTLYLDLEPRRGRWIKLSLDSIDANIKSGFGLASPIAVLPDSIFIEGPGRIISKLKNPFPLHLRKRNIDEDFMEDVEIEMPTSDLIRRDPPTVAVMFDVERMIVISDSVKITLQNIPSTVSMVQLTDVPVTISIPENRMKEFKIDSVEAVLDLKTFRRGSAKILPELKGIPPFSRILKLDSVNIKL
jgi:hypothetical protein